MKTTAIIPARYASVRFPGKPLAMIGERPMIICTWQRVCAAGLERVLIATDDERIEAVCRQWGAEVVRTRADHRSGTDRCAEAARLIGVGEGIVLNVQGDEPFVDPEDVRRLAAFMHAHRWPIGTLACRLQTYERFVDPNVVKVVFGESRQALFFSRAPIPHARELSPRDWVESGMCFQHIGMYAFRADVLQKVSRLPQHPLEKIESLEQLRWLAHGYSIGVMQTDKATTGIDTPEDLERLLQSRKRP